MFRCCEDDQCRKKQDGAGFPKTFNEPLRLQFRPAISRATIKAAHSPASIETACINRKNAMYGANPKRIFMFLPRKAPVSS
jgi:hypothetical protein